MFHNEIYKLCAKTLNGEEGVSDDDTSTSREAFAAKVCKLQSKDSFSEVLLYNARPDILVIGSGISGLNFSLRAAEQGLRILLLTKKRIAESSTNYAQGGIAGVLEKTDSFENHVHDTLEAGSYHNDRAAVEFMVAHGPAAIMRLVELGVPFAVDNRGELLLTREGGHRTRRVAFVGDYTGREIERALVKKARKHRNITVAENAFAIDLIIDGKICLGAQIFHEEKIYNIFANKTVLATGGIGQLYKYTTNPSIATGDGYAMAHRAGLTFKDMEFIQFHPTVFNSPKKRMFLISEAVRGEGAFLRNAAYERFMVSKHELAELAPRDVVARAIYEEAKKGPVYLDMRHCHSEEVKTRFPQIYQTLKKHGFNLTKDLIPITPAAHYCCGGIRVNLRGETALKNLYAFGEVAGTGVHGANRLASNSLLEALVFSDQIIQHLNIKSKSSKKAVIASGKLRVAMRNKAELRLLSRYAREIRSIMWAAVGIVRQTTTIKKAILSLQAIERHLQRFKGFDKKLWEAKNMVQTGLIITKAAVRRRHTLGCHYIASASSASTPISSKKASKASAVTSSISFTSS